MPNSQAKIPRLSSSKVSLHNQPRLANIFAMPDILSSCMPPTSRLVVLIVKKADRLMEGGKGGNRSRIMQGGRGGGDKVCETKSYVITPTRWDKSSYPLPTLHLSSIYLWHNYKIHRIARAFHVLLLGHHLPSSHALFSLMFSSFYYMYIFFVLFAIFSKTP